MMRVQVVRGDFIAGNEHWTKEGRVNRLELELKMGASGI